MPRVRGFTYLGLLIAVAVVGVGLAGAAEVWSTVAKRGKEAELLFVGDQFRQAIGRYFEGSPGAKVYPLRLEDLLEDKRLPVVRRHLRRLYPDPMTGKADWGLVMQGDRIIGVHSRSPATPLKRANFKPDYASFEERGEYSEWRFVYVPGGRPAAVAAAPAGSAAPGASALPGGLAPAVTTLPAPPPASRPGSDPSTPRVSRDPSVCAAARADDLRTCQVAAGPSGEAHVEACARAAAERYRLCLAGGVAAASPTAE